MRTAQVTLGLMAVLLLGGVAGATSMSGGPHDFHAAPWNSTGQYCLPCHVPHHAAHPDDGPIWNHDLSATTSFTRTPFGGSQEDVTSNLGPGSKTCLGCHDGSTALESFTLNAATSTTKLNSTYTSTLISPLSGKAMNPAIAQSTAAGGTLQADHPIGVLYTAGGIYNPTTTVLGRGTIGSFLENGYMQCTSCHSAHSGQDGYLLLTSNAGSALCRTCHTF
jgi:predicted CXXCH cytochrome family protein